MQGEASQTQRRSAATTASLCQAPQSSDLLLSKAFNCRRFQCGQMSPVIMLTAVPKAASAPVRVDAVDRLGVHLSDRRQRLPSCLLRCGRTERSLSRGPS